MPVVLRLACFLTVVWGTVTMDALVQREVIYHAFETVHNPFDAIRRPGVRRFDVLLVLRRIDQVIEYFKGSLINEVGNKIVYKQVVGNPLYDAEAQILQAEIAAGRIAPEPIVDHHVIIHDIRSPAISLCQLVDFQNLIGQEIIPIPDALLDPILGPIVQRVRRRSFEKGLERWTNSTRFEIVSHEVEVRLDSSSEIENRVWIFDKLSKKTFKQIRDQFGDMKDVVDTDRHLGTNGNEPEWPQYEIARGNIVPKPVGNHLIKFMDDFEPIQIYNQTTVELYEGEILAHPQFGPIASYEFRRECFQRFGNQVDIAHDEIFAHIIGPELGKNTAFIRNTKTGKFRWLSRDTSFVNSLLSLFWKRPAWTVKEVTNSKIFNQMIEDGELVSIPFSESRFHPVIQILSDNQGFAVHTIDSPQATIYRDSSFHPLIQFLNE